MSASASATSSKSSGPALPDAWRVNFAWLTRLRFGAVLGQLAVILVVTLALRIQLPLLSLGAVLGLELLLNFWSISRLRSSESIREREIVLAVGADLLLFSALLYLTGGPANPFSFLYLIHIALAAIVLPPRATFTLVGAALASSLGLFWFHRPLPHDHAHHMEAYSWHMRGMWVAFGLAACFIVYFIERVLSELRSIEQQLATERERAQRSEAVAAMGMLAAGAAHELASPLSTIAVASGELLRRFPAGCSDAAAHEDADLIRSEVERCREILDQLAVEAGRVRSSSFGDLGWAPILEQALRGFDVQRLQLRTPEHDRGGLRGSLTAVAQALRSLIKNALDASGPTDAVRVTVTESPDELVFVVEDSGPGMSETVLARATEPFFTTKPSGKGMGLGLFLAQSVAEQMGGRLRLSSVPGRGTRAELQLPLTATIGHMAPLPAPAQALAADV